MKEYDDTILFWDNVFNREMIYNPNEAIKVTEIEESLQFLGNHCKSVIDFGCGHAKMILRCLFLGTLHVYGIDISHNAIHIAKMITDEHNLGTRVTLETGSIDLLKKQSDNSYDGAILFNILDNLTIETGHQLMNEMHRLIINKGYLLLKLNPYLSKVECDTYHLKEIDNNLYVDSNGLYLWNISEQLLESIIDAKFIVEKVVEIKHENMFERLFYLRKINE